LSFSDNVYAVFGTGSDLQIYHNGSNSYIDDAGNGVLYIRGSQVELQKYTGETLAQFVADGESNLYYNNTKRIKTTSGGVEITGNCQASEQMRIYNANASIYFGTSSGGYGPNSAIGRAQVANYHTSGSAIGDLVIGAERQKNIIFGTTTSSSGGLIGRCRITNAGHFVPVNTNSFDLGTSSLRWRNLYTNDLNLSNEGSTNDVDGTWGSWTIQEGEDDLFLLNRRNGKKYKFNLTEVN
jgi:hypothetical protein